MKMKVLSPAGDMESLKSAVYNGADEVYLGVKDFNARNIEGFNLNSLKEAVRFAHIYNVRVFLTVNILFTDDEMQSALDLIVDAYNLGVDAFIIQDWGLASLLFKYFPQIELHASTQMGIHNLEGVREIEKLGFKRVVLSRETPLEEIARIRANSNIEIEYFVQGALCVSFSGNCYLSSYMYNASGNRGKCKQLCRLLYEFQHNGKTLKQGYLLSAKDFNMINCLGDLEKVGVNSLKIEGRARRPYYVATATKMYRNAVDGKYENNNIELAFNRGYTEGYFNGNSNIISEYQNHIGVEIGIVKEFKKGKKFNEILITSNRELNAKSTFKFFNNHEEVAVISAFDLTKSEGVYRITTTQEVPVGAKVNLITDYELERFALELKKKRDVVIKITAQINKPIKAEVAINGKTIEIFGEVCALAKNAPLTVEELKVNFGKSLYFDAEIIADIENVFMPKNLLNQFRRDVFEKIEEELIKLDRAPLSKIEILPVVPKGDEIFSVETTHKVDANFAKENVIYLPETFVKEDVELFISNCRNRRKTPILNLPNFALEKDVEMLKEIVENCNVTVAVNNSYALSFNAKKIIGGGMNVYNSYSADYFGLDYIPAENGNFKMPYMTMRHCPMKEHLNATCASCPFKEGYTYKMFNNSTFKLRRTKMTSCTFYLED